MTYIQDNSIQKTASKDVFQKRFQAFRLLLNAIIEIEEATESNIYTILSKNLRKICNASYVAITLYSKKNNCLIVKAISHLGQKHQEKSSLQNKLFSIPISVECVSSLKKSSVIKCTIDNCYLKNYITQEMLQQDNSQINKECYQVSCMHENELIAIGLVQMAPETEVIVRDIIITYMHILGTSLQRMNALSALKNNQIKLEELNSQLKTQQALLVQQEQLASIGQLAAGVAHEINNPVGFVMSNIGTLTEYVEIIRNLIFKYEAMHLSVKNNDKVKQESYCKQIDKIYENEDIEFIIEDMGQALIESKEGTKRVQTIVQNLKSFARLDPGMMKLENINEGIEASLKLVWNELKYKCTVNKYLENIPLIKCSLGELNQVFMNLLLNAGQSIKEKGTINITSKHSGNNIEISISDTGSGIPEENVSRIFEPFFTTKDVGKGTGLGLSISHGIIQKHNGKISVQSKTGQGSTFTIILPCSEKENE